VLRLEALRRERAPAASGWPGDAPARRGEKSGKMVAELDRVCKAYGGRG
jgi:hypothetical protein